MLPLKYLGTIFFICFTLKYIQEKKLNELKLVSPILLASLVYGQNITYNVITSPSSTSQSVAVVVDNTTFPLSATNGILYSGEAPIAKGGYSYAILENSQINSSEPFSRSPVTSNTPNEFFNRSRNEYQVVQLPQALPELPNINRVESKLHNISQIPTIHLWGNQSEIDFLHKNQLTDIDIRLNMTYIGYYFFFLSFLKCFFISCCKHVSKFE